MLPSKVSPVLLFCAVTAAMGAQCPVDIPGLNNATGRACRTNLDCGPFKSCNTQTGQCRCVDDRGCGEGEFCNAVFQCQTVSGCGDNTDCETQGSDLICSIKNGQCGPRGVCIQDSQCPLGRVCDDQSGACIDACRDEADCALGGGCIREGGSALGRCRANACSRTQDCPPGRNCDLATNTCVEDLRGPFCGPCQSFDPSNPQCGDDPANYCLIDTSDPTGNGHYCGVDCSQEQGCPSGFACQDVIIVGPPATPQCGVEVCNNGLCSQTGAQCQRNEDCPIGPPGGDCARGRVGICAGTSSQTCMSDADCGGAMGSCRTATCSGGENSAIGFCSCVIDADCPADECRGADLSDPNNPVSGRCFLSGRRCYAQEDCNVIACVNGGCLIGRNCAPDADRRCQDLRTTP